MSTRRTLLLFAVLATLVACSPGPEIGRPLTSAQSFEVQGRLTLTPLSAGGLQPFGALPTTHDFVLWVDPAGRASIAGGPGEADRSPLASHDGVAFQAVDGFSMALRSAGCGASVTYASFRFNAGADGLAGTATGTASILEGDVSFSYTARLEFTGVPDTTGPSLRGAGPDLDPLARLYLSASEPLSARAVAHLAAQGEVVNLVSFLPDGVGAATGFATPNVALRYGTRYAVVVDPWTDLAGNPGATIDEVTTVVLPPLVAEDGFEGAAATLGGAAVVGASVLPPISGQQSIFIAPGNSGAASLVAGSSTHFTVRLAVSSGDRFVRFSLRPLSPYATVVGTYNLSVRLAVPGAEIATVDLPATESLNVQQALPSGGSVWMGETHTMEAALPAGATDEVVFSFNTGATDSFCGLVPPAPAYLLDDLRVE